MRAEEEEEDLRRRLLRVVLDERKERTNALLQKAFERRRCARSSDEEEDEEERLISLLQDQIVLLERSTAEAIAKNIFTDDVINDDDDEALIDRQRQIQKARTRFAKALESKTARWKTRKEEEEEDRGKSTGEKVLPVGARRRLKGYEWTVREVVAASTSTTTSEASAELALRCVNEGASLTKKRGKCTTTNGKDDADGRVEEEEIVKLTLDADGLAALHSALRGVAFVAKEL